VRVELAWREEDGPEDGRPQRLAMALWHPGPGWTMISSGVLGGGLGPREWVLNAQVPALYARMDPAAHLSGLARQLGLAGPGVGLLTAAQVTDIVTAEDAGVHVAATVGLRVPTWAAAPADTADPELAPIRSLPRPGTINIIVSVPVPLSEAAYVNAVMTATEAKSQAVIEAGFAGTGTASDAICVAAPTAIPRAASTSGKSAPTGGASAAGGARPEDFTGPRSPWGGRIARAVHTAVVNGAAQYWAKLHQNALSRSLGCLAAGKGPS
jgi:adenosylcobinamide amidohydrolase